ncbi:hypothetical protein MYP_4424 [Sporocytophaga myxococcoides]|uniref:Uncharacterized protein n=1 Tax=Sporocytophaga myxococcoides TaxID=153721 RepID=A0A098LKZ9_9BACT|nr:hypothetical protein MYP_4424 [Sporocytophaga myxococcoides]
MEAPECNLSPIVSQLISLRSNGLPFNMKVILIIRNIITTTPKRKGSKVLKNLTKAKDYLLIFD